MWRKIPWILVLVGIVSCSESESDPQNNQPVADAGPDACCDAANDLPDGPPALGERSRAGRWLAGDFHVHATDASNDTGGDSFPPRIKEVAIERGLDFVVLTDHSNSTGSDTTTTDEDPALFNMGPEFPYWDALAGLSDETFLFVDGNEMSPIAEGERPNEPTGHIGCYPRDLSTFDPNVAFTDRPRGAVDGAGTIQQAKDAGCFVTLNHPFGPAPWISFDWTTREYEAVEVFNGSAGWDTFDHQAMLGYICDAALGTPKTALGGSDNHRVNIEPPGSVTNPPLGSPTTYVFADGLTWPGIINGLDNAWTSVSDTGTPLELDVFDAQGEWLGMPGDRVTSTDVAWLRVRGDLANTEEKRFLYVLEIAPDSCNDTRVPNMIEIPEPTWNAVLEEELASGPFEYRLEFSAKAGHSYLAWIRPESDNIIMKRGVAFTSVLVTE